MRITSLCLLLVFVTGEVVPADDQPAEKAESDPGSADVRYLATIAEYRVKDRIATKATEREILDFLQAEKLAPVETVRLSAAEGMECMAQFGKRVTVTTGKMSVRGGIARQTEQMEVGTIVSITIVPHVRGALAEVSYTASRLQGEGTDDSPPEVTTTTVQTTQVVELGKPRLMGATDAGSSSYMFLTIIELP